MRPSFLGLIATGLIIMITLVIYVINFRSFTTIEHLEFWLLFGILIGVHSVLHHIEEIYYFWNPLVDKWKNNPFLGFISKNSE